MAVCPHVAFRPAYEGAHIDPHYCVLHRTIGRWAGDLSVLTRGSVPSVHFLIGQNDGEAAQLADTNRKTNHAAGGNGGIGIEFSGQNSDVEALTAWQIQKGGEVVRWISETHGIPLNLFDNGRIDPSGYSGFLNHNDVPAMVTAEAVTTHCHHGTRTAPLRRRRSRPRP